MPARTARTNLLPPDVRLPALVVSNRQRLVRLDFQRVRGAIRRIFPACLDDPGSDAPVLLAGFEEIGIHAVSESVMARVHVDFLGIEGPTDVITFPYGEILICPAVACENAIRYGVPVEREIVLYAIHGLLHLNGYDDISAQSARRMRSRQANLLKAAAV